MLKDRLKSIFELKRHGLELLKAYSCYQTLQASHAIHFITVFIFIDEKYCNACS